MKTREFDIENYKVEDIIKQEVVRQAKEYASKFEHPFLTDMRDGFINISTYYVTFKPYESMTKTEQASIIKIAKAQYEEKKAKTIKDYTELKEKCDNIFFDDKQYAKLVPELTNLYYCQAHTALKDFYSKKIGSMAAANSRFRARAMQYSTISCD